MLIIKDIRKLYSSEKVLFPSGNYSYQSKSDIIKYVRFKQPAVSFKKGLCYTYNTLFSDLSGDEEDILAGFSRTTKQQIKKSLKDDTADIKIKFYTYQDLLNDDSIIPDLKNTYLSYCEHVDNPKLKGYYRDRTVSQYIEHKCILVSKAEFPCGKVYHLYVWSKEDSLFEYSASDHLSDEVVGILAGMANKLLVYQDMLWLKEHGVKNYDWGGIFSFENPNGIDRFKMLFGGRQAKVYHYFVGNTIRGKLLVYLKKCQDSIRNKVFRRSAPPAEQM